jgi:hypothetical protein
MPNPSPTNLGVQEILQKVYESSSEVLRTSAEATIIPGSTEVELTAEDDSILAYGSTDGTHSGRKALKTSSDGTLHVTGSAASSNAFATGTPTSVSVTSASTVIVPANPDRMFLRISNFTATAIWLQYNGNAAPNTGVRLLPNTVFEINNLELFTGNIHAISAGGTVSVGVFEGTE